MKKSSKYHYRKYIRKYINRIITVLLMAVVLFPAPSLCNAAEQEPVDFVDFGWVLVRFHNRVAGFIIEHGYQRKVDYVFLEHIAGLVGLEKGDVDIYMDLWPNNCYEWWTRVRDSGSVSQVSINYDGGTQGWYVPTYVIEGDPERGIEPMAPDLKAVTDLKNYWELFVDPEVKDRGRFLNGPTSWVAYNINTAKLRVYGLDEYFVSFSAGGTSVLLAEVVSSYKKGKPILFYFWDPTWLMGLYDFTLLEEPPFDESLWNEEDGYPCEWVKGTSYIVANSSFVKNNPAIAEFLGNYETTLEQNRQALLFSHENESDAELTALWFLKKFPGQWKSWIPSDREDVMKRVEEELSRVDGSNNS